MRNINFWNVFRILLLAGCLVGAYGYMISTHTSRKRAREYNEMQREQYSEKIRKIEKEKKEAEQLERDLVEKADDAEFQLDHWFETWKDLMLEQERIVPSRASSAQISNMKKKLEEARETVNYWADKRESELEAQLNEAKENGDYKLVDKVKGELERCRDIRNTVNNKQETESDEPVDSYDDDSGYLVDGIRYVTEDPSRGEIRAWKERYKSLCRSKISDMMDGYDIPQKMITEEPCLVYLIIKSESVKEFGASEWFGLYNRMDENQVYKLYNILYREMYKYAKIKDEYSY